MNLTTHHLVTSCLAALVAVAIGVAFQERRRRQTLLFLIQRFLQRSFGRDVEKPPF